VQLLSRYDRQTQAVSKHLQNTYKAVLRLRLGKLPACWPPARNSAPPGFVGVGFPCVASGLPSGSLRFHSGFGPSRAGPEPGVNPERTRMELGSNARKPGPNLRASGPQAVTLPLRTGWSALSKEQRTLVVVRSHCGHEAATQRLVPSLACRAAGLRKIALVICLIMYNLQATTTKVR